MADEGAEARVAEGGAGNSLNSTIELSTKRIVYHHAPRETVMASQSDLTGMVVWPASQLLADFLGRNTHLVTTKRVIELGCGCALVAAACAEYAALTVATDGAPETLDLALRNLRSNAPAAAAVHAERLRWGSDEDRKRALALTGGARFDVALASEVFYHFKTSQLTVAEAIRRQASALCAAARELLQPDGLLLLVYSPRYAGMAPAIREAVAATGMLIRTIARSAVLTDALKGTHMFTDTRMLAVSASAAALAGFASSCGDLPEAEPWEEDDYAAFPAEGSGLDALPPSSAADT